MEAATNKENLSEDPAIKELARVLNEMRREADAANVIAMAVYVGRMEEKLSILQQELEIVKKQIDELPSRAKQKPVEQYQQEAESRMKNRCSIMKSQMSEIKTDIKRTAGQAAADLKQCGAKGLNRLSEFFGIRKKLEKYQSNVEESLDDVKGVIEKIDKVGHGLREAKRQAANAMRTLVNMPEKEYAEKKFSKTELLKKPYLKKEKDLNELLSLTGKAIGVCDKISQAALQNRPTLKEGEEEGKEKNLCKKNEQKEDVSEKRKNTLKQSRENSNVVQYTRKNKCR